MRISDWSSDVCSSDLFAALPMVLVATALAVLQEGIEEFLQDQVELSGSRLAGWGHGLQSLSELIHGDRDLSGETTGARGICGLKRPIKVCSEIRKAHVCTLINHAQIVCRLMIEK